MAVKCPGDLERMPHFISIPELDVALRAAVSRGETTTDDAFVREVAGDQNLMVSKARGPAAKP